MADADFQTGAYVYRLIEPEDGTGVPLARGTLGEMIGFVIMQPELRRGNLMIGYEDGHEPLFPDAIRALAADYARHRL